MQDTLHVNELADYLARHDPGTAGEFLAYMEMTALPAPRRILRNVYIPHWQGHSTEIDLLLIHTTGFYVIESKNYSGEIYGDEGSRYWEARYPASRSSYELENPIRQNATHARALQQYISFYCKAPVHSVIAYGDWCTVKCIRRISADPIQCHYRALRAQLNTIISRSARCLSPSEVDMFYQILLPLVDRDREAHTQRMKERKMKAAEASNRRSNLG